MKIRTIISIVLAVTLIQACDSVKEGSNFKIKGRIGSLNAPAKLYLSYYTADGENIDSTAFDNGKFVFSGSVSGPSPARLVLDYTGEGMQKAMRKQPAKMFYVENGVITINSEDSLQNVKINSPINKEYESYIEQIGMIQDLNARMNKKYQESSPEQKNDTAFMNSLNREYRKLLDERAALQLEYAKKHTDAYFGLVALSESSNLKFDVDVIEPVFQSINEKFRNSDDGKALGMRIIAARTIAIGKPAPDFSQNDVNGKAVKLSDFRGKYVLLDFWASWCGPCRMENPNVVKVYEMYKDKNFDILGVSLDKKGDREAWLAAIEKDGLKWTNVSDLKGWNNEVARMYGIRAIPQNYLINPDGIIIKQNLRGEELVEFMADLMK